MHGIKCIALHPSYLAPYWSFVFVFSLQKLMDFTAVRTNFQLSKAEEKLILPQLVITELGGIVFRSDTCKRSRKGQADALQGWGGGGGSSHPHQQALHVKQTLPSAFFLYSLLPACFFACALFAC